MLVTATFVVAAGVGVGLLRLFGEPVVDAELAVGALAFGAVVAAPGLLAFLALPNRPALLLPAALVLVPLSFLSFALVTLPLLVPAFLLVRACARATPPGATAQTAATGLFVVALLVAALLALFAWDDPRQYRTGTGFTGTSDVVSYLEATISLACTAVAVGVGARLAPRTA